MLHHTDRHTPVFCYAILLHRQAERRHMRRAHVKHQPCAGHVLRGAVYENKSRVPRVRERQTLHKAPAVGASETADPRHGRAHLDPSHADGTLARRSTGARHGNVLKRRGETHPRVQGEPGPFPGQHELCHSVDGLVHSLRVQDEKVSEEFQRVQVHWVYFVCNVHSLRRVLCVLPQHGRQMDGGPPHCRPQRPPRSYHPARLVRAEDLHCDFPERGAGHGQRRCDADRIELDE